MRSPARSKGQRTPPGQATRSQYVSGTGVCSQHATTKCVAWQGQAGFMQRAHEIGMNSARQQLGFFQASHPGAAFAMHGQQLVQRVLKLGVALDMLHRFRQCERQL